MTDTATAPKTEKIMQRIQRMLALADHPNTPEAEREVALTQANALMMRHAIDEAIVRAGQSETERRRPISETFEWLGATEFNSFMRTILTEIARTNRCRLVADWKTCTLVGFHDDVAWTQMLYTSVLHHLVATLNPTWDANLGYDENVYRMKVAGRTWAEINDAAVRNGHKDASVWKNNPRYDGWNDAAPKVLRYSRSMHTAYRRHADLIGDTTKVEVFRMDVYRREFAKAFTDTVCTRLEDMREANRQMAKESGAGTELVLVDLGAAVDEEFYRLYPEMSPEHQRMAREAAKAADAQRKAEHQAWLDSLTPAQRDKHFEQIARDERIQAAKSDRYWNSKRGQQRMRDWRAGDATAEARGTAAGSSVDLVRRDGVEHFTAAGEIG